MRGTREKDMKPLTHTSLALVAITPIEPIEIKRLRGETARSASAASGRSLPPFSTNVGQTLACPPQPPYNWCMARPTRKSRALPPAADDPEEGQALQTGGVQSSEGGTTKAPDTSGTDPIVPRRPRRKP